ncbi:DEAD/DEAH box helicase family protein [Shewanella frigidimarina]|uniref:DEAD/DEAH box helicase family protein n=1 Tax=Shewanella frigidimarina TaxID=56812 RepID=UPI003F9F7A74|tara:strand:+ start:4826 stop:7312 length:2487 start_codon:yes stop_codon:yes gene_type:complete
MKELTLGRIKHKSFFEAYEVMILVYMKLFTDDVLLESDIQKILSMVVLFTKQTDEVMRRFGYRMALAYGIKTKDIKPLYDISINSGVIPIAALINNLEDLPFSHDSHNKDSFLSNMVYSYIDNFRVGNIVFTEQQYILNAFFDKNINKTTTIVAPTSYGKSELIISAIKNSKNKRICIVVPSKALLAQTRKRVLDAEIEWVTKIVSHPEMHNSKDVSSVYILTQERLTRILNQDQNVYFDIVIVDEAHNLLSKDNRNILLASVISILKYRSDETGFKFLTPFLADTDSLNLRGSNYNSQNYKVNEYVKSECIYIANYIGGFNSLEFYDHFTGEFISLKNENKDYHSYILKNSEQKNLIYFNRPKHIQIFAKELADKLPEVNSKVIDIAIKEISSSTHNQYLLLYCLKRGVLYHHGSMNDAMRNYTEYLYRTCDDIKYLVSNSTLLEGVNLPVQKMFLLSIQKGLGNLKPSQFKNLIGRINRFSEIFDSNKVNSLKMLMPEVHIVGTDDYSRASSNFHSFCEKVMGVEKKDKDIIENVLLDGTKITDKNKSEYESVLTRLENLEAGITSFNDLPRVKTKVGLKLLESNISEIDIFTFEFDIEEKLSQIIDPNKLINDSNTLMSVIYNAFISFIDSEKTSSKNNLLRLKSDKAQTFYAMFLDWNIESAPLPVMIQRFIKYWDSLPVHTPVFVGSWGDTKKEDMHREVFTYINLKTISEKINLAIVRIKEEEDFFDYVIFRFIDILNELELIDENFYKLAKYGTTNKLVINLIQNGFSRGVSEMLLNDYHHLIEFNGDNVSISPKIHEQLVGNGVGFLQRYEVSLNVINPK